MKVVRHVDGRGEFIHYKGPIPYTELNRYYHRADGFVFASSCENMPNILLEAMASGLPIACSNRASMPEFLEDAGVYFNPNSVEEIVAALGSLLGNSVRREECAQLAYERAQNYSWEKCAKFTLDFLVQIAKSG
jgi:glycosyltransferase involved in cell wall biosynthesis